MRHMHHLKIRVSVFLCSILMTAFGIDLITVASLGTSPISSVPLVVSLYTPWTFGQLTFVLNMAFIVLQIALLRRQFRPVELLQIAINFVFSAAIDFFMHAMTGLQGLSWPFAAALLVAGCATLAFGICIEVASQVLMVPGDGAVKAIAQTGKWRMGSTKVAFDSTMVTIAVILSTLYGGLGTLTGLGVGTLVSAMLVGRFVNFFNRRVFFIERLARLSLDDETKAARALSKEVQS